MTIQVAVIFGGANSEHEVSCASAEGIIRNLDRSRFHPVLLGIDRNGGWHRLDHVADLALTSDTGSRFPDLTGTEVAFPALHGRFGEDGTVQGMLELSGIPYVGCGVLSSALAMDKAMAQRVLEAGGIRTPATCSVTSSTRADATRWAIRNGFPVFVKPNRSGSSVGATLVSDPDRLDDALDAALAQDRTALVQALQVGEEVDLAVLSREDGDLLVGAPLRVIPAGHSGFFDYDSKYRAGGVRFEVPARVSESVVAELRVLALQAFELLGCEGLARVDFFVRGESIVLNEVNTMPGMTAQSQVPQIWAASGIPFPELLTVLLDRALVVER